MEPGYIRDYGRYVGRRSLSANIGEEQLRTIEAYIDREDGWTLGGNCSRWSLRLWNAVVEEDFALKTQTLVYTPERVEKALCEFDCVETDRDFPGRGISSASVTGSERSWHYVPENEKPCPADACMRGGGRALPVQRRGLRCYLI